MFLATNKVRTGFDTLTQGQLQPPTSPLRATILPHPLPTPTHGAGGIFTVACAARFSASPETCLRAVLDPATFPEWNRFTPQARILGTERKKITPPLPERIKKLLRGSEDGDVLLRGTEVELFVSMDLDGEVSRKSVVRVSFLEEFDEAVPNIPGNHDDGDGSTTKKKSKRRKGLRVAWKTGGMMPGFLLKAERVQEFLELDDDDGEEGEGCEYVCWETFYGGLAPVVKMGFGDKLEAGFQAWMDGLGEFVGRKGSDEGKSSGV